MNFNIEYMKWIVCLFLFIACGKFNYSPFAVDTKSTRYNEQNAIVLENLNKELEFPIRMALVSDSHNFYTNFDKIIKDINTKNYHLVIHAGDLTNFGRQDEFNAAKDMLKRFNIPYLTTIGNHDHLANGRYIYERMFGDHTYALTLKNIRLIFYDNNNWESDIPVPNYNWLETELVKASEEGLRSFVIGHVPAYDQDRFSPIEIERLETMASENNVVLMASGHEHTPQVTTFAEIPHITIGAAENLVYYEVIFDETGVSYEEISL